MTLGTRTPVSRAPRGRERFHASARQAAASTAHEVGTPPALPTSMTLPEVLREVMRMLGDIGCDHVDIAREGANAYQYRFTPDRELDRGYRLEGRRWLDGSEEPPPRGASRGYVGWSRWSTSFGFSPEGALADDWRLL